jgi:tetratricopeptide (TPR) repeat protein
MSASRATEMRQDFAYIANSSMDANVSVKGLQEAQLAVGQALGTNAQLNDEDLETLTKITKQTGLQHDELIGIEKLSLSQGKSLDSNLKSALGGATAFASQNKLVVNNNKVLKEVNKASSSLKLSLGGSVEALGKAVVQAQKFGINLEQAENIAQSLLNFESSIEDELSAELLTGKNINLEKARGLALEGKSVEAAAEILKQVGGTSEFSKMNVIQQEAMAKAVGMTRDQLADSLIEREALAAMSAKEGETALQAYERLKASGKTEKEIVDILGQKAADQLEQQSAQEKFNNALEKAQEIFVQIMDAVAPIFDILSSIVTTVLPAVNFILQPIVWAFKTIGNTVSGLFNWLSESKGVLITLGSLATGLYVAMNGAAIAAGIISTKKKLSLMWDERSLIIEKGKSVIDAVRLGYQTAMGSLAAREALMQKKGLALSIGKASMNAIASLSSIPVVGWALGLAAAGTVAALGYSYMKDGVIGPVVKW